jgi:hypothetical protein
MKLLTWSPVFSKLNFCYDDCHLSRNICREAIILIYYFNGRWASNAVNFMAVKTKKHLVPVESTNLLDQMFNEKCHEVKKLWITRTGHQP